MKRTMLIFTVAAALGLPLGGLAIAGDRDGDPPRARPERREARPPLRSFRADEGPPADARPARRGGYLPDTYRGALVDDYQRYRLRAPPRGYAWVRVGGGFALVSLDDGRIFDMVQ